MIISTEETNHELDGWRKVAVHRVVNSRARIKRYIRERKQKQQAGLVSTPKVQSHPLHASLVAANPSAKRTPAILNTGQSSV